jgi:hypothetical protein
MPNFKKEYFVKHNLKYIKSKKNDDKHQRIPGRQSCNANL